MDLDDFGKLIATIALYILFIIVLNNIYVWAIGYHPSQDLNKDTNSMSQANKTNNVGLSLITIIFPDGSDVVMVILDFLLTAVFGFSAYKYYT
jgi:hypothetical protein